MFKTKYAVEQHKGWWYALKCKTLFGVTIKTEYISRSATTSWNDRDVLFSSFDSEKEAYRCVEKYKKHLREREEFQSQNSEKRWVE